MKKEMMKDDPNVVARKRAGRRAMNRSMGKDINDGLEENPTAPTEEAPAPENEGGIVDEAKQEEAMVAETAEENAEEANPESPAEEMAEGEEPTPEVEEPTAEVEEAAAPEAAEMPESEMPEEVSSEQSATGEYQAPEGPTHDELIDQYHEALSFGDMDTARELYKQLQEHRFRENTHRAKYEANAEQEARAYVDAATELANRYPELGEDGLAADRVLALSDVYRNEGMKAADALRKAVADLYQEAPAETPVPEKEASPEVTVAKVEPEASPVEPAEVQVEKPEAESMLPDMTERKLQKRSIPAMPSASARNEPAPPPKQPTRMDAIQRMKELRGQA